MYEYIVFKYTVLKLASTMHWYRSEFLDVKIVLSSIQTSISFNKFIALLCQFMRCVRIIITLVYLQRKIIISAQNLKLLNTLPSARDKNPDCYKNVLIQHVNLPPPASTCTPQKV